MPLRQVRLDDDVADLVAAFQDAEGLKSLSSSANRMLRLAAAEEPQEPAVPEREVVSFGRRPGRSTRGRPVIARVAATPPTAASGICPPHPALARRGNLCGRCGATL